MSLKQWEQYHWLVRHESSTEEIRALLAIADRDIAASQVEGLPLDWRLNIAHNALLQTATALLAAAGYRAERDAHHYRVMQSLQYTIRLDEQTIDAINRLHRKRNVASYTTVGAVSEVEADRMLSIAVEVRRRASEWFRENAADMEG